MRLFHKCSANKVIRRVLRLGKHNNLPPNDMKHKGRVAFEGVSVSDQSSNVSMRLHELACSASLSASQMIDTLGCLHSTTTTHNTQALVWWAFMPVDPTTDREHNDDQDHAPNPPARECVALSAHFGRRFEEPTRVLAKRTAQAAKMMALLRQTPVVLAAPAPTPASW